MSQEIRNMVREIVKSRQITHVFFAGCGGSYGGLYPAKYFLQSEAKTIQTSLFSANEFCHVLPAALGKNCVVVTQSLSGTTPETARAAKAAKDAGAVSVAFTRNPESLLAQNADYVCSYGESSRLEDSGTGKPLLLALEILQQTEGFADYDALLGAFEAVWHKTEQAKKSLDAKAETAAEKFAGEKLIYMMGSGPNWGINYVYSMGMLQEMQWIHSDAIHSGEYFHGPFEITDKETPFVLLLSAGKTRPLDRRALDFLTRFGEKILVIDCAAFMPEEIAPVAAEYLSPLVVGAVLGVYYAKLTEQRLHPPHVRRYMGKLQY